MMTKISFRQLAPAHIRYDQMRSECPVLHDASSGMFVLTRYHDVRALLSDDSMWRDPDKAEPNTLVRTFKPENRDRPEDRESNIGWMDAPDHARVRVPLARALYKRVAATRPAIERIVADQIAEVSAKTEFDALNNFAAPIPIAVIGHILGVETRDAPTFRALSEAVLKVFAANRTDAEEEEIRTAGREVVRILDAIMIARRAAPRDDLISDLICAQAAGAPLSDSEIRVSCFNLLVGGNLTTADLIANALWLLLSHPTEFAKLRADPALINGAIEEVLRYEPPVESTQRIASRDMEIHGCPIRKTQTVATLLVAANRDPAVFSAPHEFDITRKEAPHVTFGGGAHICIGAPLARLEAQIAVAALISRFPALRLAEPDETPVWRNIPFFRGLEHLRVKT
jgi:cytochrome P450